MPTVAGVFDVVVEDGVPLRVLSLVHQRLILGSSTLSAVPHYYSKYTQPASYCRKLHKGTCQKLLISRHGHCFIMFTVCCTCPVPEHFLLSEFCDTWYNVFKKTVLCMCGCTYLYLACMLVCACDDDIS